MLLSRRKATARMAVAASEGILGVNDAVRRTETILERSYSSPASTQPLESSHLRAPAASETGPGAPAIRELMVDLEAKPCCELVGGISLVGVSPVEPLVGLVLSLSLIIRDGGQVQGSGGDVGR